MNDYLGNLVTRSFELGDIVQPRPVSLFEPVAATNWPASADAFNLGAGAGEPASGALSPLQSPANLWAQQPDDLSTPPRQPVGQPPLSVGQTDMAQGHQVSLRSTESKGAAGVQSAAETFSSALGPSPRFSASQSWDPPTGAIGPVSADPSATAKGRPLSHSESELKWPSDQPAPGPVRPTGSPALEPLGLAEVIRPAIERVLQSALPARPAPLPATDRSSENVGQGREQPMLESVVQQIVIERSSTSTIPAVDSHASKAGLSTGAAVPESRTAAEAIKSPSSLSGQAAVVARPEIRCAPGSEVAVPVPIKLARRPEPSSTIQVTIGRIEVRAIPPPAPLPKAKKPQPAPLSLAEYLRQRANGGKL